MYVYIHIFNFIFSHHFCLTVERKGIGIEALIVCVLVLILYNRWLVHVCKQNFTNGSLCMMLFSYSGNMSRANQPENLFPKSSKPDPGWPSRNDQSSGRRPAGGHRDADPGPVYGIHPESKLHNPSCLCRQHGYGDIRISEASQRGGSRW